MSEPLFRSLTQKECFERYGFSKEDMEKLYNNGKGLKYNFKNNLDRAKELRDKCARNIGDYCDDCNQEAKQLKEKVEKGCGKRLGYRGNYDIHCGVNYLDGIKTGKLDRFEYCKDCQETLKILTEILGEGN